MSAGTGAVAIECESPIGRSDRFEPIVQFSQYKKVHLPAQYCVINFPNFIRRHPHQQHDKPHRPNQQPPQDKEKHHRGIQLPIRNSQNAKIIQLADIKG